MILLLLSPPSPNRDAIAAALAEPGHEVVMADSAAQATARLARGARQEIGLVVLDLAGGPETLRFLRRYAANRGHAPVIGIADRRQPDASSDALRLGVVDIVARPVRTDDLLAAIANARELKRLSGRAPIVQDEAKEDAGDAAPDAVLGTSPAMRDVLGIVRRVAPSRCRVLLVGERGSGREMIARAIHDQGRRREGPFVRVACADTERTDFERLLDAGAAPGTTVYLDELGDLPADAQSRLEGAISGERAGQRARLMASAQPRLAGSSGPALVRPALLDAIGVVRIDVPPLRQRSEDVPLLALRFLKEACRRGDVPSKTFSRSALTLLAALPWPGNAAELRSLTERLAVLVPRGTLLLEDVLANIRFDGAEALGRQGETLRTARERFERDYVTAALQHHHGRMGAAARALGIERTNLYRKIKQLKIRWTVPE